MTKVFLKRGVLQSASATIVMSRRLGGLNNRNTFPPSSGGWESVSKVLVGLAFLRAALLGLKRLVFSLSLNGLS